MANSIGAEGDSDDRGWNSTNWPSSTAVWVGGCVKKVQSRVHFLAGLGMEERRGLSKNVPWCLCPRFDDLSDAFSWCLPILYVFWRFHPEVQMYLSLFPQLDGTAVFRLPALFVQPLFRSFFLIAPVRLQQTGRRSICKNSSENREKVLLVSGYFKLCENLRFSLSGSRCMSDAITSTKLKRTGKYFGTADAVWMHGYLRFEPGAWKWNEGLPCLCADCKIRISLILFKFSHSILHWTALPWNFFRYF